MSIYAINGIRVDYVIGRVTHEITWLADRRSHLQVLEAIPSATRSFCF
jgi:hypothetical protein